MATFVHIADIHVGMGFKTASFSRELGNERRREIKETLFRVIRYCEDNEIDLLLIAGDLFEDDYVSISDLKDMNHRFSRLQKTKVLISAGNHDPVIDQNSCYNLIQWCKNVYLFDTQMSVLFFEDIKTEVHSFSWHKKHLPAFNKQSLPELVEGRKRILMLHGDAYNRGDYLYVDPADLEGMGYDYVALGHIHKTDYIQPWMAYPGSLEPLDFSEEGAHGFIKGKISSQGLETEFVAFAKRSFHVITLEINGHMTYEEIKDLVEDSVRSGNPEDLYRIILTGLMDSQVTLDLCALKSHISEFVHYIEVKDKTQADLDIEQLKQAYKDTLIGAYINYMDKLEEDPSIKEEALYEGLKILLREQVV